MPERARRIMDQEVILTTLTASGVNSFGEVTFQETVTSGVGFLKITDRLVSTNAGAIPVAQIELLTDPRQLSPSVRSTATVQGKTYEIREVRPTLVREVNLVDRSILEERHDG
jgi:hypothetical protein